MNTLGVFDYPGGYTLRTHGEQIAQVRMDELQTFQRRVQARSTIQGIAAGDTFALSGHPRADQGGEYLVVCAKHRAVSDEFSSVRTAAETRRYECEFSCIPRLRQFRTERVTQRPRVEGPQTAIVTGTHGRELYIDRHARVKVQFHWDRYGNRDENSSCWIRVNQPWAGKNFGGLCVPRIGQEVIVDFLEGDPDRPIITGRVYNGASMPPISSAGKNLNPAVPKPHDIQPNSSQDPKHPHVGHGIPPRPAITPENITHGLLPAAASTYAPSPSPNGSGQLFHDLTVNAMATNGQHPRALAQSEGPLVAGSPRPLTHQLSLSGAVHTPRSPVGETPPRYIEQPVEPPGPPVRSSRPP